MPGWLVLRGSASDGDVVVAANCGPPFGTKRPQVQILSTRPVFPQARGPHQKWCGPLRCQYSNDNEI